MLDEREDEAAIAVGSSGYRLAVSRQFERMSAMTGSSDLKVQKLGKHRGYRHVRQRSGGGNGARGGTGTLYHYITAESSRRSNLCRVAVCRVGTEPSCGASHELLQTIDENLTTELHGVIPNRGTMAPGPLPSRP